jgi:hypothetical protein
MKTKNTVYLSKPLPIRKMVPHLKCLKEIMNKKINEIIA